MSLAAGLRPDPLGSYSSSSSYSLLRPLTAARGGEGKGGDESKRRKTVDTITSTLE